MAALDVKPGLEEAKRRLRIDDELAVDLQFAIDQAHAEAEAFLDGVLYADEEACGDDAAGILVAPDIIAAQLLLADALVGSNDVQNRVNKREAAFSILRRHRRMGA
jgi:hypothetical protein